MSKQILIMGQIDHGKSTFLRALAQVTGAPLKRDDESELSGEELELQLGEERYRFFSYDRNSQYEKEVTGQETAAVMICSGVDGPMRETEAQLRICAQRGLPLAAVVYTKVDLFFDEDYMEIMVDEMHEVQKSYGVGVGCPDHYIAVKKLAQGEADEKAAAELQRLLAWIQTI